MGTGSRSVCWRRRSRGRRWRRHRPARRPHPGRSRKPLDPGHHIATPPAQQQPRSGIMPPGWRLPWPHATASSPPPAGPVRNPVRVFSLDELAETARKLERERPGRTVDELSRAVFAELAMKRTRARRRARRRGHPGGPGTRATRRDHRLAVAGQHTGSQELGAQRRLRDRQRRRHPRTGDHRIQQDTPRPPVLNHNQRPNAAKAAARISTKVSRGSVTYPVTRGNPGPEPAVYTASEISPPSHPLPANLRLRTPAVIGCFLAMNALVRVSFPKSMVTL